MHRLFETNPAVFLDYGVYGFRHVCFTFFPVTIVPQNVGHLQLVSQAVPNGNEKPGFCKKPGFLLLRGGH